MMSPGQVKSGFLTSSTSIRSISGVVLIAEIGSGMNYGGQVVQGMVQDLLDASQAPEVDLAPLLAMLEAECVVLYERFVERRGDVLDVCERIASTHARVRSNMVAGALLSAGAIVASGIVPFRRRAV